MSAPLSDPLPLRDTRAWPATAEPVIIPWVFGRAWVTPLRYDVSGRRYILADHALAGVDAVTVNDQPLAGWQWSNGADVTGHACAFLDLADAPSTGTLAAQVRGQEGNPADILAALGVTADLQELRITMRQAGIELGGALTEGRSRRAAIQFVVDQFGGCWSAGMPGYAAPFPPPEDGPIWAEFGPLDRGGLTAECELTDLITRLTVSFAAGRQTVTLLSDSARAYGDRAATLDLPWIATAREAAAVGQRRLNWRARPLWMLKFQAGPDHRHIPPGGWIALNGSDSPVQGRAVVMDLDPGIGSGIVQITAQAPAGAAPVITIAGTGERLPTLREVWTVRAAADTVTLTITDPFGLPLPGAAVWLDADGPQTADATAQVTFAATPGRHVVRIEAANRPPILTEITL